MKCLKVLVLAALVGCFAAPVAEAGLFRHRHKSVVKVVTKVFHGRCAGGCCR